MNVFRKIMVFAVTGLFFGAGIIPVLGGSEGTNVNSLNIDDFRITSPSNGQVVSGTVYISWTTDFHSPWSISYNVYCADHLVASNIKSGFCYWNSKLVPDGICTIRVNLLLDTNLDGQGDTIAASDSVQVLVQNNDSPIAYFTWEVDELTVTFTCISISGKEITFRGWDFTHDGRFDAFGKVVSYTFPSPGTYKVTLTVQDDQAKTDTTFNHVSVDEVKIPTLDCSGFLSWSNVKPGGVVTGSFRVRNVGDSGSLLNWKVESYPDWGEWTFNPISGTGLTPEDGDVVVDVYVVAPDVRRATFYGEVVVVNTDDSSDYERVPVSLATSRNQMVNAVFGRFLENYPFLFSFFRTNGSF